MQNNAEAKRATSVAEIIKEAGLDPETAPPICAKLYPFQIRNVLSMRERETVLLAWQMGAGKTWGATALAELWDSPILVVIGPKSVVDQWVAILEAETDRTVYNSYTRGGLDDFLAAANELAAASALAAAPAAVSGMSGRVALCTSDDAYRMDSHAQLRKFINKNAAAVTMICDESSRLGDPTTKRTKAVMKTKTAHKILLSGTPATSGKMEKLIPAMRMMGWPITKAEFLQDYCITDTIHPSGLYGRAVQVIKGYKNIERLRRGLVAHGASFLTMEEAGVQLPEAIDQVMQCVPPTGYVKFMKYGRATIEGVELIGDMPIVKLTRARQICGILCRDKLSRVHDILEAAEGERVVIFYNYTAEMKRLEKVCAELKRPVSVVNGQGKDLAAYETSADSVTLIQYQSGAMGLNLQWARICIFFTPCLSYSDFEQAKARIHRIGQGRHCVFYELVCRNSVEEHIYETLAQRGDYTAALFAKDYSIEDKQEGGEGA